MAQYPEGGGHWCVRLQYLSALKALGYDFHWLELFRQRESIGPEKEVRLRKLFFRRFARYGLADRCVLLSYPNTVHEPDIGDLEAFGEKSGSLEKIIQDADLLLNFHCSMREPLLSRFRRKVLLDLDPGHLQVGALIRNMCIDSHDALFTVGLNMGDESCAVPCLGRKWRPFFPPVHLPLWRVTAPPTGNAALTSVTQWNWGPELPFGDTMLSASKRDAYRRFIDLPRRAAAPLKLAANIGARDDTGDREELLEHGWALVHPHRVARSIEAYQRFIAASLGEFGCAKPLHAQLRTGWFSDRSVAYLASGRPVVVEDTGFGGAIAPDAGVLTFSTGAEAREAIARLIADYPVHQRAAREIAATFCDAEKILPAMIERALG